MDTQDWFRTEYETPDSQSCIGLSPEDALEAARASGLRMYRVIDALHNAITFDLRRDRFRRPDPQPIRSRGLPAELNGAPIAQELGTRSLATKLRPFPSARG